MQEDILKIRDRLAELDALIAETERRLPAHSTKPPVMMDLLALEDERDLLLKQLAAPPT
ncbi:MAG: hypothetical protein Q8R88_05095 [Desulfoprunum sp.]|nr:hypothetical protein [Desulfoprunum sp.]